MWYSFGCRVLLPERNAGHQKKIACCAGLTTTAIAAHGLLRNSRRKFVESYCRIYKSDHGGIFTPQI